MCPTVRIDIISVLDTVLRTGRKVYAVYARSLTTSFYFWALRSTGTLVRNDLTRFCGIVAGRKPRVASEGADIDLVGMFDLPENRADGG